MKKLERSKSINIVNDDGEVFLSTWVGNENLGGGNVKLNGVVIVKGLLDNYSLGIGRALRGKVYVVRTNGLDINPFRDDVPVTHLFSGPGLQKETRIVWPEEADNSFVAGEDGIVSYVITYSFI